MSLFDRVNSALRVLKTGTLDDTKRQLDIIAQPEPIENKQALTSPSKLDVRKTDRDMSLYYGAYPILRQWAAGQKSKVPPYGDPRRDDYLDNLWRQEPILAGAIYSMTAKMTALKWQVTGPRLQARAAATLFANAEHIDGHDWGGFIGSVAQDFYIPDRGPFIETARGKTGYGGTVNRLVGNLAAIGHIDSLCCWLTGNRDAPMVYYSSQSGQNIRFKPGEFIHFTSLPSPREFYLGMGFSAVSRALRAAILLMGLHDYDSEKLNNLPPEGVASVTGLTMDEFMDALKMWKTSREQDKSYTFPQVLWLIGSQPNTEVKVAMEGFSSLPESFDRESVVNHYVATLALCFGVDAREFWPVSSGSLGTAAESEIQHLKAKGKGPGEFISITERHFNSELPEDVTFAFDTQDIEEDQMAAQVCKAWVDALFPLYNGIPNPKLSPPQPFGGSGLPTTPGNKAGQQAGEPAGLRPPVVQTKPAMMRGKQLPSEAEKQTEQVIDKDQFIRLLIDHGALPEWLANDKRTMIADTDARISKEGDPNEYTKIVWKAGVLTEERLPAIVLNSMRQPIAEASYRDLPYAEEKEEPIMTTGNPIRDELERWIKHPILKEYILTDKELSSGIMEAQLVQSGMVMKQTDVQVEYPSDMVKVNIAAPKISITTPTPIVNVTVQPAPVSVQSAPINVNVQPTPITVDPTPITVEPASITVNVEPTPITVNVPAQDTVLEVPESPTDYVVEYDSFGKVKGIKAK